MNDTTEKNELALQSTARSQLMRVELASLYGIDTCTAFVREHADGSATINHGRGWAVYPKDCWRRVGDVPSSLASSYRGLGNVHI